MKENTIHTKAMEAAMNAHMLDNNFEKELKAYFNSFLDNQDSIEEIARAIWDAAQPMGIYVDPSKEDCFQFAHEVKAVIKKIVMDDL